jgi:hypothetical protein
MPAGGWNGNGQSYGWTTHQGVDYGTAPGKPIIAPFGGTVKFETGLLGYGNRITLTLANGFKFFFGHVAAGVNGPVTAGMRIGTTGSNVGSSKGSVTLVEVHNPSGQAVNPHTYLDPIFRGGASVLGLFGAASDQLFGAASGQLTAGTPPPTPPANAGPDWQAAFDALVKNLQAAPAEAGKNAATQAAAATSSASSLADIASGKWLKNVLPTPVHVWRSFFVGLGVVMIGVGVLIYFKGDDMVSAARALPGEAEEAGADAASVAEPEAAPAIQAAKPKPKKVNLTDTPGDPSAADQKAASLKLAATPGE